MKTLWSALLAYNEERSLPPLLGRFVTLAAALRTRGAGLRILVVDDGSRDGTAEAARAFQDRLAIEVIPHGVNRVLGAALYKRLGYEEAAARIQDHYLAGRKLEAMAAVPDSLVDEVALVGPADRIRARLAAWREAGRRNHVGSLLAAGASPAAMRILAEELL